MNAHTNVSVLETQLAELTEFYALVGHVGAAPCDITFIEDERNFDM